ncbi:hypothetical protein [Flavobacterium columnare]|uniref:hypothetical protein n=1 Tax=Flavobacterium columnare TaxID=996 RepID=UPI001BC88EC6|nr:hypothetical protein [Flavobacterium columnare]AUX18649.1 hypothetical protein AQ623_10460 [Flavobacterium columnare]AUX18657.1 hypothetical protein AQ623_10500 [Flavobacterium columnare]
MPYLYTGTVFLKNVCPYWAFQIYKKSVYLSIIFGKYSTVFARFPLVYRYFSDVVRIFLNQVLVMRWVVRLDLKKYAGNRRAAVNGTTFLNFCDKKQIKKDGNHCSWLFYAGF